MADKSIFRVLLLLFAIALLAMRLDYRSGIIYERGTSTITGRSWRSVPSGRAALMSIIFSSAVARMGRSAPGQ